jgi:hypothetical protein
VGHFCPPGSGPGDPIESGSSSGSTTLLERLDVLSEILEVSPSGRIPGSYKKNNSISGKNILKFI